MKPKNLCVVIPAYNEEATIADIVDRVPRELPQFARTEVIVVVDGATDRTADLARKSGATVIEHDTNLGVGAAFRTGVLAALRSPADVLVTIDADGQFAPEDISHLLQPILDDEADCVTASRFKDARLHPKTTRMKFHGNRFLSLLISVLVGKRYHDVSCGFRAYRRSALLKLNLFGDFTYTHETFLDLSFKHVRIAEVPVQVAERVHGQSHVASNLIRYGIQASRIILISFCNYRPLFFFGGLSLCLMVAALSLASFVMVRFVLVGAFSPYRWVAFLAGFLFALGSLFFALGVVASMIKNVRLLHERTYAGLQELLLRASREETEAYTLSDTGREPLP